MYHVSPRKYDISWHFSFSLHPLKDLTIRVSNTLSVTHDRVFKHMSPLGANQSLLAKTLFELNISSYMYICPPATWVTERMKYDDFNDLKKKKHFSLRSELLPLGLWLLRYSSCIKNDIVCKCHPLLTFYSVFYLTYMSMTHLKTSY